MHERLCSVSTVIILMEFLSFQFTFYFLSLSGTQKYTAGFKQNSAEIVEPFPARGQHVKAAEFYLFILWLEDTL